MVRFHATNEKGRVRAANTIRGDAHLAALARLLIIGFVLCTILYFALSYYGRSQQRAKLRDSWENAGRPGDRETYVNDGLAEYEGSLRRKLIWGVYVVPFSLIALIIYFVNFY